MRMKKLSFVLMKVDSTIYEEMINEFVERVKEIGPNPFKEF